MDDAAKKHIRNLTVAAVSAVPVVGGPMSVLLDKYVPDYLERKRVTILEDLSRELEVILALHPEVDIKSDEFMAIFVKCVRLALEETEREKVEAFRNIILNATLPHNESFSEVSYFIRLVQTLSSSELLILNAMVAEPESYEMQKPDLSQVLGEKFPSWDTDYIISISQELFTFNLVRVKESGGDPGSKLYTYHATRLGVRFMNWIAYSS